MIIALSLYMYFVDEEAENSNGFSKLSQIINEKLKFKFMMSLTPEPVLNE